MAVGLALAALATAGLPAFYESFLYIIFSWIALATSWAILSGYAGYFSFGHGAFFGAGMYTTATLTTALRRARSSGRCSPPALIAAALGAGIGAVVFRVKRLRGELFGLLTLAITFVLATIVLNTRIDGGPGVFLSAVPLPRLLASPTGTLYLLGLALAVATVGAAYAIGRSRLGFGLFAIHDDEDVAEVEGVPTFRYKLVGLRALGRHRRGGRRHPRDVRELRHGGRDVLDHGAALRRADERARRRAPLAGPGGRRDAHRRLALRLHRRPAGGARAAPRSRSSWSS